MAQWDENDRRTTLGAILILMFSETAQHAGHADIVRELVDGAAGPDHDQILTQAAWQDRLAKVRAAADTFQNLRPARAATYSAERGGRP